MANETSADDPVPGTELLVDVGKSLNLSHAGAGTSDIVLILQPTPCGGDPVEMAHMEKVLPAIPARALGTYLHRSTGFVNIWWIPTANKIGRRFVFLATTVLCMCVGV
ncbi:hypothetical protein VTN96DRAFT_6582 [Rasamsonia emersonii]